MASRGWICRPRGSVLDLSSIDRASFAVQGPNAHYAVGCKNLTNGRSLTVGQAGSTTFVSVNAMPADQTYVPVSFARLASQNWVQTATPAGFRVGTTETTLTGTWQLDLAEAAGDSTKLLEGIAVQQGAKLAAFGLQVPSSGTPTLYSGVFDEAKLTDLGSTKPPALSHTSPMNHTPDSFDLSRGKAGIAAVSSSETDNRVLLHWFGLDGSPRVANFVVTTAQGNFTVKAAAAATIADLDATKQTLVVAWYEEGSAVAKVRAGVVTCQ